jgi:hypothetical protein
LFVRPIGRQGGLGISPGRWKRGILRWSSDSHRGLLSSLTVTRMNILRDL